MKKFKIWALLISVSIIIATSILGTTFIFYIAIFKNPLYILCIPIVSIMLKFGNSILDNETVYISAGDDLKGGD